MGGEDGDSTGFCVDEMLPRCWFRLKQEKEITGQNFFREHMAKGV